MINLWLAICVSLLYHHSDSLESVCWRLPFTHVRCVCTYSERSCHLTMVEFLGSIEFVKHGVLDLFFGVILPDWLLKWSNLFLHFTSMLYQFERQQLCAGHNISFCFCSAEFCPDIIRSVFALQIVWNLPQIFPRIVSLLSKIGLMVRHSCWIPSSFWFHLFDLL